MRFTILEEIKSTLPKLLFYDYYNYSQIKSNKMLDIDERGKPEYQGKNHLWQSREAKSRLHMANRMPKSLSIDYSNNSESLRPKIT